jgi:hypothetical protein
MKIPKPVRKRLARYARCHEVPKKFKFEEWRGLKRHAEDQLLMKEVLASCKTSSNPLLKFLANVSTVFEGTAWF